MAYQNNSQERKEVTTRGHQTTNSFAETPSAFEWSYRDDQFKIVFSPELPESERSEKRRYDYDHSWVTFLSRTKSFDLLNHIKNYILPAMKEKKDMFVSVSLAEVNQFGIGIKFKEDGKITGYAKLIRNIDPNTLISDTAITYEFKIEKAIINYDNTTGKFEGNVADQSEMLLFVSDLECFVKASSKAWNHANRVVDKAYKDMVMNSIRAIGTKVGAEMPSSGSAYRSGARYGQASLFDNPPGAPAENVSSITDLDELPFN